MDGTPSSYHCCHCCCQSSSRCSPLQCYHFSLMSRQKLAPWKHCRSCLPSPQCYGLDKMDSLVRSCLWAVGCSRPDSSIQFGIPVISFWVLQCKPVPKAVGAFLGALVYLSKAQLLSQVTRSCQKHTNGHMLCLQWQQLSVARTYVGRTR